MKKLFTILGLLCCSIIVSAQTINWGVEGGYTLHTISGTGGGYEDGFRAGVNAQIPLSITGKFYFHTGLSYQYRKQTGAVLVGTDKPNIGVTSDKLHFLHLPVYVGMEQAVGSEVNLFAEAGPYVEYAIAANGEYRLENMQKTETYKPFSAGSVSRFNWGLGARVGVELFTYVRLSVGYDLGLKTAAYGEKYRSWIFTVGYMF